MNLLTFERRADQATENCLSFAKFVAEAEFLSDDPCYRAAWFDAEMVNALALAEWEDQGRPDDWADEWQRAFKADAVEVTRALRSAGKTVLS